MRLRASPRSAERHKDPLEQNGSRIDAEVWSDVCLRRKARERGREWGRRKRPWTLRRAWTYVVERVLQRLKPFCDYVRSALGDIKVIEQEAVAGGENTKSSCPSALSGYLLGCSCT